MLNPVSPLAELRAGLASGAETPSSVAERYLANANGNASRNTYLWLDEAFVRNEAASLEQQVTRPALYGVPVSLKDCFDLAGTVTTAGRGFMRSGAGWRRGIRL